MARTLGLKVDDEGPDDDDSGPPDDPEGPNVDEKSCFESEDVDDSPSPENAAFAGNSSPDVDDVDDRGPFSDFILSSQPREGRECGKRSTSSTSSTSASLNYLTREGGWTKNKERAVVLGSYVDLASAREIEVRYHRGSRVVSYESGEPYDVYVGRGKRGTSLKKSKWHNPFVVGKDGDRMEVIEKFTRALSFGPVENHAGKSFDLTHLKADLPELAGKTLCCHCAPEPCHADVLLGLAQTAAELAPYTEEGMAFREAAKAHFKETTGAYWVDDAASAEQFMRELLGEEEA